MIPYTGPARITVEPPNYSGDISPYVHRGRVNLGLQNNRIRKVEKQSDGVIIETRIYNHENQIKITIPQKKEEFKFDYGVLMVPRSDQAPLSYRMDGTPVPNDINLYNTDTDNQQASLLALYVPNTKIAMYPLFNWSEYSVNLLSDIPDNNPRKLLESGTSVSHSGISWSNIEVKGTGIQYYTENFGYRVIPSTDLTNIDHTIDEPRHYQRDQMIRFDQLNQMMPLQSAITESTDSTSLLFTDGGNLNCIYYKGRMVPLPSAGSMEKTYNPAIALDGSQVTNVRIGGAYLYKDNTLLYSRSEPLYAGNNYNTDIEEICLVNVSIDQSTNIMTVNHESLQVLTTFDYSDIIDISGTQVSQDEFMLTSSFEDWKFNSDGTQAKKVVSDYLSSRDTFTGTPGIRDIKIVHGYEVTLTFDKNNSVATVTKTNDDDLMTIDYNLSDEVQRAYIYVTREHISPDMNDVVTERYVFPWGYELTQDPFTPFSVDYIDLKHQLVLYTVVNDPCYFAGTIQDSTTCYQAGRDINVQVYWNTNGKIYDESVSSSELIWRAIPTPLKITSHPTLITDNYKEGTFEIITYSHTVGFLNMPIKSYNSNTTIINAAGLSNDTNPSLDPIRRI